MCRYCVTLWAVIWPTFLIVQATLFFVVVPGISEASNPQAVVTQFIPSSSLPDTFTRFSFRPWLFHPSSTKLISCFTPSSVVSSIRGITTKSVSAFFASPTFCTMQPFSAPYPLPMAAYSRSACCMGVSQKGTVWASKVRVAPTCFARASMASVSPMICTMSDMSPLSGSSGHASFRSTSRTRFAVSFSRIATVQAWSCPGCWPLSPAGSLSGRMITSAPVRIRV